MSDKINISTQGEYINKRINVTDTFRLQENMSSINSVVFTNVKPVMTENSIYNSVLTVSGKCNVDMIYLAESSNYDRISFSVPFEITENCRWERGVFFGKCEVYSVDITPIKGRRCDVSIYVDISGYIFGEDEIFAGNNIQTPYRIYRDEVTESITKTFSLYKKDSFEYVHPSGFADGIKIIYSDAEIYDVQTNHSPAGILINGVLRKNIIYSCLNDDDTYSYHFIDESVSFNQFCEVGYSMNFTDYIVKTEVSDAETYIRNGEDEADICMNVTVSAEILLLNNDTITFTKDIFSPEMDVKCAVDDNICCKIDKTAQKEIKLRGISSLSGSNMFERVLCGKEDIKITLTPEDDCINVAVKCISECVVIMGERAEMNVVETAISDNFRIECTPDKDSRYICSYTINDSVYKAAGGSVETIISLTVDIYELSSVTVPEITEYTAEEYIKENDDFVTIRIHYDTEDVSPFEIARENRKSVDEIKNLIKKNAESAENTPLIIWENAE